MATKAAPAGRILVVEDEASISEPFAEALRRAGEERDRRAAAAAAPLLTKSGLMVGLGETRSEIRTTLRDLRGVGVDIVTIGQYLSPSRKHLGVEKYYTPEEFASLRSFALGLGFGHVESGPLVRSSFHAEEQVPR